MRPIMLLALTFLAVPALAAVPGTISYQGWLEDSSGNPVPDAGYAITVKIYNVPTGGDALWSELLSVNTLDGLFSTVLGSTVPIPDSAWADSAAYLEITVETDPPITPRSRLSAVPYARVGSSLVGEGPFHLSEANLTSGDSGSVQVTVSADSGVSEITTAHTGAAQTTGKRQHRPVSITKEWGATDGSASGELSSIVHADSGFSESWVSSMPDVTVEGHENGHAFGNGHLSSMKQVSNLTTAMTVQHQLWLEPDSGVIESTTAESTTGTGSGKRVHKPFRIVASSTTTSSSDTASWSRLVDTDSGYAEVAGMTKSDLITEIAQGTSQTREHILLSRQVGSVAAPTMTSLEMENSSDGPKITMTKEGTAGDPSDDGVVILNASVPGGLMFAMVTYGDTATATTASSDKRKQSLYFPGSLHSALDLLVDGAASMVILKKIEPVSGGVDSNVVIDNEGSAQFAGQLTVGGPQGTVADGTTFTVPRITTSERDALTAVNGMVIYNITTNQFNFHENGAWVTK